MRMRMITASVLGLGLSAILPAVANADQRPNPRDNDRPVVRREEARDVRREPVRVEARPDWRRDDLRFHDRFERVGRADEVNVRVDVAPPFVNEAVVVPANEVPGCVLDTINRERHGWPIGSIERVCENRQTYFRVRIDRQHMPDLLMTIQPDGDLLTRLSA